MQKIANIPFQDPRFKLVHVHREYVQPLQGVCTFNGKLCIFNRQFDDERVDIFLIPFTKRVKLELKMKLSEIKKRFKL